MPQPGKSLFTRLGEDWIAVIIGLGLVALVSSGLISHVPWPLFAIFR